MGKKHYTKEQLAFYFKKLQAKVKRVPTEFDLIKEKALPSLTVYRQRFGSWSKACELFGNKALIAKQCKYCKRIIHQKRKDWKFCSNTCQHLYAQKLARRRAKIAVKEAAKKLGNKCVVCGFSDIVEVHDTTSKVDSELKLARHLKNNRLDTHVVLCPNHHLMIHKNLGTIQKTKTGWKFSKR